MGTGKKKKKHYLLGGGNKFIRCVRFSLFTFAHLNVHKLLDPNTGGPQNIFRTDINIKLGDFES